MNKTKNRRYINFKNIFGLLILMTATSIAMAGAVAPEKNPSENLTSPAQIFGKVVEKYKTCKSFSAEAQSSDGSNTQTTGSYRSEKTAKIWFKRPELLRVDVISKASYASSTASAEAGHSSIFIRNGQVYTFESYGPSSPTTYGKRDSLSTAISAGAPYFVVPSLLLGINYYQGYPWTRGKDITVDGQACFNLNSVSKSVGTVQTQWAISKTTFEVLQTRQAVHATSAEVESMMEEAEKITGKMPWFKQGYPALDNETKINYKNNVWDPALKESDFDYAVPKEAKLVTEADRLKMTKEQMRDFEKIMKKEKAP
jgi:outer membrane lipoprotein-sorting protein